MKLIDWIIKLLTIGVFLWPVGPLGVLAVVLSVVLPLKILLTGLDGVNAQAILAYLIILGGALGSIALLLSLFSIKNKLVSTFLVFGVLSYSSLMYQDPLFGPFNGSTIERIWVCVPLVIAMAYIYLFAIDDANKLSKKDAVAGASS